MTARSFLHPSKVSSSTPQRREFCSSTVEQRGVSQFGGQRNLSRSPLDHVTQMATLSNRPLPFQRLFRARVFLVFILFRIILKASMAQTLLLRCCRQAAGERCFPERSMTTLNFGRGPNRLQADTTLPTIGETFLGRRGAILDDSVTSPHPELFVFLEW